MGFLQIRSHLLKPIIVNKTIKLLGIIPVVLEVREFIKTCDPLIRHPLNIAKMKHKNVYLILMQQHKHG